VSLLVDTSVWSLALRRSPAADTAATRALKAALQSGELVLTTGIVVQELLQGFKGPAARDRIRRDLSLLPRVVPRWEDHLAAADLRNNCRRKGVTIGTIDALIAAVCIGNDLRLLTADRDFERIARLSPLQLA
jgi:predicted nucleic acid-binding protein